MAEFFQTNFTLLMWLMVYELAHSIVVKQGYPPPLLADLQVYHLDLKADEMFY